MAARNQKHEHYVEQKFVSVFKLSLYVIDIASFIDLVRLLLDKLSPAFLDLGIEFCQT